MYSPFKFGNDIRRKTLIDTGACANAMQADFLRKIENKAQTQFENYNKHHFQM